MPAPKPPKPEEPKAQSEGERIAAVTTALLALKPGEWGCATCGHKSPVAPNKHNCDAADKLKFQRKLQPPVAFSGVRPASCCAGTPRIPRGSTW